MNGSKSALASLGVWGGIVALVAPLLSLFGIFIPPADVTAATGHVDSIVTSVYAIVGAVGGLIAIWGRIRATKTIGS